MALENALRALGYDVVGPVGRVAQAVDLVSRERLDGAILDIKRGDDHAFPVAEALQARSIPFILATGCDRRALPEQFHAVPHLRKPFDGRALEKLVRVLFPAPRLATEAGFD